MNRWNIPPWPEQEITERDTSCVYCGTIFGQPTCRIGDRPSWEHIVNNLKIITREKT